MGYIMANHEIISAIGEYIDSGLGATEIFASLAKNLSPEVLETIWRIPRENVNKFVHGCLEDMSLSGPFLDLGCGRRSLKPEVIARFGKDSVFVGVDHFINRSEIISEDRLPDVQAKAELTPFRSKSLGTVFCLELLEHVPDEKEILAEISRVLQTGGKLILSIPGVNFPKHEKPPFQLDYRRLSKSQLASLLQTNSFTNIEISDAKIDQWQINIFAVAEKI